MANNNEIKKAIEVFKKPSKHIKCVHKCENGMEFLSYSADLVAAFETAIDGLKELEQYKAIGTVEQFRESLEKQKAKHPVKNDNCENKCASYRCPNCFELVSGKHCEECGQAIDLNGLEW